MFLLKFIKSPKARYILGLVFLLGVVLLWVGSSFLTSYLFQDQSFNRPFFLTYFNTGCFSLYLVIVYSTRLIKFFAEKKSTQVEDASSPLLMEQRTNPETSYVDHNKNDIEENVIESGKRTKKFTDFETAKLGLQFCILWFIANYASNLSYVYTSVASSTILSSTSGVFTLILGQFLKTEKFTKIKLLGVAVSLAGVIVIALLDSQSSDTSGENHSWKGDLIALLGSLFYGFYITFLKLKVDDELVDPQLFLGFVGLSNLIILIPIFPIVHYTGFEIFSFPPNGTIWGILFIGALLGTVLSDYLWLYSVMLTSPLVTTLGLSFTIPISIIGEIIIHSVRPSVYYYIGAALVILGFFGVNSVAWRESSTENPSPSNDEDNLSQITAANK